VATTRGETPLHLAVEQGDKAVVQQLLTYRASVDAKDNAGNQPLHNAILQRNKAIIELLLQAGGDVNSANYVGNTPLAIARELGMSKMFSIND
jgi:serine/threonine-protein phosphatase 6 regulatory ankyrin repeat subunit B